MGDILVGTASWADKSLLDSKLFYPKEAKTAESRLRYYAENFPLVEVDSSYYALPAPQVAELWAQRTPETFVFDIKAFRIFTQHQTPPQVLPPDIREARGTPAERKKVSAAMVRGRDASSNALSCAPRSAEAGRELSRCCGIATTLARVWHVRAEDALIARARRADMSTRICR
jgi:uncharacterized protein YecE (DUF72 family)